MDITQKIQELVDEAYSAGHLEGYKLGEQAGIAIALAPTTDDYDQDGYDEFGYDRDGYDRNGYDDDGIDRDGFCDDTSCEFCRPVLDWEDSDVYPAQTGPNGPTGPVGLAIPVEDGYVRSQVRCDDPNCTCNEYYEPEPDFSYDAEDELLKAAEELGIDLSTLGNVPEKEYAEMDPGFLLALQGDIETLNENDRNIKEWATTLAEGLDAAWTGTYEWQEETDAWADKIDVAMASIQGFLSAFGPWAEQINEDVEDLQADVLQIAELQEADALFLDALDGRLATLEALGLEKIVLTSSQGYLG
jgi:hypothetical protein